MSAPTIATALERGRNGFTGLRLLLALAVVVSHAFSVATGAAGDEPSPGSPATRWASTR